MSSLLRLARPSGGLARRALPALAPTAAAASGPSSAAMLLHTSRALRKDPQLGDYPDAAYASRQLRKDSPRWWDRQEKLNFGETLNEQEDVLGVWAPDLHPNVKPSSALFQFAIAAGVAGLFASLVYAMQPHHPAIRRSYPRGGLAEELGGPQVAARDADATQGEEEESEEDDE